MTQAARAVYTTRHLVRALIPLLVLGACSSPGGHGPCEAESDAELCAASGRRCGPLAATDRCGAARTLPSCGECAGSEICGADGLCAACTPEPDAELCRANGLGCGVSTAEDRCGHMRMLACGECPEPWTCGADSLCHCTGETDEEMCAASHYECGRLQNVVDRCGLPRDISSCGSCAPDSCASDRTCRIRPESDGDFCASQGRVCGAASGIDKSGLPRFVANCGECMEYKACTPAGVCRFPGDDCQAPIALELDGAGRAVATVMASSAVGSDTESSCEGSSNEPDVVFSFTLTSPKLVIATLSTNHVPTESILATLFIRSACDQPSTEVACSHGDNKSSVRLLRHLEAGTWFLWADGLYGGEATLLLEAVDAPPPPENDRCAGAVALAMAGARTEIVVSGTTTTATDDSSSSCGGAGGRDLVYTFALAASSDVKVTFSPDGWSGVIYVTAGCAEGPNTAMLCKRSGTSGASVTDTMMALEPGTYAIWVDGTSENATGAFTLKLNVTDPSQPPPNDTCAHPEPMQVTTWGFSAEGDTRGGHDDLAGSCGGAGHLDVVYSVHVAAPSYVAARVDPDPTTPFFEPLVHIRGACGDPATELGCGGDQRYLRIPKLPPGDYFAIVDGLGPLSGKFALTIALVPPQAPSSCSIAAPLLIDPTTHRGTVHDDTRSNGSFQRGSCTPDSSRAMFAYWFNLPSDSAVTITAAPGLASSLVPELMLRSVCNDAEMEVGCSNGALGTAATLRFPRLPAGIWYLLVGDGGDSEGTFDVTLDVSTPALAPSNDTCTGAEALAFDGSGPQLTVQRNAAGAMDDEAGTCGGAGGGDVVFAFDLAVATAVRATVTSGGSGFAPIVYLRESCASTAAADERGCAMPIGATATLVSPILQVGRHYLIVDATGLATGAFTLELAPSAPFPDTCAAAVPVALVPGQPIRFEDDTTNAHDDNPSARCAGMPGNDLVYAFTTQQPLTVTARMTYPSYRGVGLALRSACASLNPLDEIGCIRGPDPWSTATSTLWVPRVPAGTWYLWVDGLSSAADRQGPFALELSAALPAAAPANDLCATAQDLVFTNGFAHVSGDVSGASDDLSGTCGGAGGADAVYRITVPAGNHKLMRAQVLARSTSTPFQPMLYVRSSCLPGSQELACANGTSAAAVSTVGAPGDTYYLIVDSLRNGRGEFDLDVWIDPVPPQPDACSTAQEINLAQTEHVVIPLDMTSAANDARSLLCASGAGPDLVVSFDTTGMGTRDVLANARFNTGSGRTVLYLRTVCATTSVANERECGYGPGGIAPQLVARSVPEGRYYLWIDSDTAAFAGPLILDLAVPASPGPPANDTCAGPVAVDLSSGSASLTGALTWATADSTMSCGNGQQPDVVYTFTVSQAHSLTFTVSADPATPNLRTWASLRTACSTGSGANEVLCAEPGVANAFVTSRQSRSLAAGTYYLWIATEHPEPGAQFGLDLAVGPPITSARGDDCDNALGLGALSAGTAVVMTGSTLGAHADTTSLRSALFTKDLVYSFSLDQPQRVLVTVTPLTPGYEPALEVRPDCAIPSANYLDGTAPRTPGLPAMWFKTGLTAGTWYLWISSGDESALPTEGDFELRIEVQSPAAGPGNDQCTSPRPLTRGVVVIASTVGSCDHISGPLSPLCGSGTPVGSDATYSYTPTTSAPFDVVVTATSGFQPTAWVSGGLCGDVQSCIAIAAPGLGERYQTTVSGVAGRTYYVMVDGGGSLTSGICTLEVR